MYIVTVVSTGALASRLCYIHSLYGTDYRSDRYRTFVLYQQAPRATCTRAVHLRRAGGGACRIAGESQSCAHLIFSVWILCVGSYLNLCLLCATPRRGVHGDVASK